MRAIAGFLVLGACSFRPDAVPNEPGVFGDEGEFLDVVFAANPYTVQALWYFTDSKMNLIADDNCPKKTNLQQAVREWTGGGCTDQDGIVWTGKLTVSGSEIDDSRTYRFEEFGVDMRDYSPNYPAEQFVLDGAVTILEYTEADLGARGDFGWAISTDVGVDWTSEEGRSFVSWNRIDADLLFDGATAFFDRYKGKAGVEAWGVASVDGGDLTLPTLDCMDYIQSGSLELRGDNVALISFDGCTCATWSIDGVDQGEICELPTFKSPLTSPPDGA